VGIVVDDVPFGNGSVYIFFAVLLCLHCDSYVFSRKYVEVESEMCFVCDLVFTTEIPSRDVVDWLHANTLNQNNHTVESSWSPNTPTSAATYFLGFCLTILFVRNFLYDVAFFNLFQWNVAYISS